MSQPNKKVTLADISYQQFLLSLAIKDLQDVMLAIHDRIYQTELWRTTYEHKGIDKKSDYRLEKKARPKRGAKKPDSIHYDRKSKSWQLGPKDLKRKTKNSAKRAR